MDTYVANSTFEKLYIVELGAICFFTCVALLREQRLDPKDKVEDYLGFRE